MKNKNRIIQVILILAIFGIIITCWSSAASNSYSLNVSGDYVSSSGSVDSLDITGFNNAEELSILYELKKGENAIRSEYSLYPVFLDMDGNVLNMNDYPYIYYGRTGYYASDITIYFSMEKYLEYCKDAIFTDLLNQFQISFETRTYKDDVLVNSAELDRRTVKLVDDKGNLCKVAPDTTIADIGKVQLEPIGYQNKIAFSELEIESIDLTTNTYTANVNISMGAKEDTKSLAFDVNILCKEFPNMNMLPLTNNVVHITRLDDENDYYSELSFGKNILDPLVNDKGEHEGVEISTNKKYLILQSSRSLNANGMSAVDGQTDIYKVVFDTFNSTKTVTLLLNVTFNFEEAHDKELGTCLVYDGYLSQRHTYVSSPLILDTYFNYYPYKVVLENENGDVLFTGGYDFSEYWLSKNSKNSDSYEITLTGNLPSGFYTLKGYEYEGKVTQNQDGSFVVPNDDELIVTTINSFYIDSLNINKTGNVEKGNISLGYTSDGKNVKIEGNEITLDVYINENYGLSIFDFYGELLNSKGYTISSKLKYKVVSSLDENDTAPLNGISINNDGILMIRAGAVDTRNFYLLVSPTNGTSYIPYKVKLNNISYQQHVLYYSSEKETVTIPSFIANPVVLLKPNLVVDGIKVDIKDYNYSYKVLNLNETVCNTLNVVPSKDDGGDYVSYNDLAEGAYLIRCTLDDFPDIYADFELIVAKTEVDDSQKFTYKIVFENTETEVAVPNDSNKENRIKLKASVYRDDELTTIVPNFTVVGDTNVSIREDYLIIDSDATIGNSVVVTAIIDVDKEKVTAEKVFKLVEQNEDNSGNIVDKEEGGDDEGGEEGGGTGGGSTGSYIIPSSIKLVDSYDDWEVDDGNPDDYSDDVFTRHLGKSSGEKFVLKYICYDEKGKQIQNPSVSIKLYWDDPTGTSIVKDYVNKEIEFSANGIYSDRRVTLTFEGDGKVIDSFELNIKKPTMYVTQLWIVQDEFARGGKMEARAIFTNNSLVEVKYVLAIVCYDKNDKIVSSSVLPCSLKEGESTIPEPKEGEEDPGLNYVSTKLTLPYDLEDITVKAFLLEGESLEDAKGYFHGTVSITNREGW